MLCNTLCRGQAADAASPVEREVSTTDPRIHQRPYGLPTFMSFPNPSRLPALQVRTSAFATPTAASMSPAHLTVLPVPVSPIRDDRPTWSASTGGGFLASGNKRPTVASKTSFQLAHPPPAIKHRERFNIRPKILLQLQQISDATRPIPVFDVVPSFVFAPKLARKLSSIFKGKDGLGADDLVIVNSQKYDSSDDLKGQTDNAADEDSWDAREVVAAICQPKRKAAGTELPTEICLHQGAIWKASPLSTGAYEFVSVDEGGNRTIARWVPRPPLVRRRTYNGPDSTNPPLAEQRRFTFSIINPESRRHPVIATLSRSSIDVSDQYSVPSVMSRSQSSNSSQDHEPSASESAGVRFSQTEPPKTAMVETDERLKSVILVTGIWVAFREGFSPNFHYDKLVDSTAHGISHSPSHKSRSLSLNLTHLGKGRNSGSESPKRETISRTKSTRGNSPALPIETSPQTPSSSGAAFLQRANTRRPALSKKPVQTSSTVTSTSRGLEQTPGAEQPRGSSYGHWNSANPPTAKSMASTKPDAWDQRSIHDKVEANRLGVTPRGSTARKSNKLNKLLGLIRRTSGAH